MNLVRSLRINPHISQRFVFVGSGGKTTALFQLARELPPPVIVTATTHLGAWQTSAADMHVIANTVADLKHLSESGVVLVTGGFDGNRTKPVNDSILYHLYKKSKSDNLFMLIEADGARQKPLTAHAAHEPPIPNFADAVVVVAGLSALGKTLNEENIHRAEIFSQLGHLGMEQIITPETIMRVLAHPQGGLKNIPNGARRIMLLNQADTPEQQSIGGSMARTLLAKFDAIMVGSLQRNNLKIVERCAGIVLAAGESKRFGNSKQLLDWNGKPFVRQVAETALHADLNPVIVVTGFDAARIESALTGLPVQIAHNPNFQQGQSASIKAGIKSLSDNIGACVFLLADQPQIPMEVIRALVEMHTCEMQSILAPLVLGEHRANPVLFDRVTFADLLALEGDVGGRGIFHKHHVEYLPWYDEILLFDVDKPEDYERLKNLR